MAKVSKRRQYFISKVDKEKKYSFSEAVSILKNAPSTKFDQAVDVAIKLGIDPTKSTQNVRGASPLPAGTGKKVKIAVICEGSDVKDALEAGAVEAGMEELITSLKAGNLNYDVIIAHSNVMSKVAVLGRTLGPRGLMPNPRTGTVTTNIKQAVEETVKGKVSFRNDKLGNLHGRVGSVAFSSDSLKENMVSMLTEVKRLKPAESKGIYIVGLSLSSTMGPGVPLDPAEFA